MHYLIEFDRKDERGGLDGLLDGKQHNTLDAEWYGKVHVLCSLYLAALRAAEGTRQGHGRRGIRQTMADIYEKGRENIAKLYNGEFYIQIEDPAHLDKIGVGTGCYIDQVMGQFWANQVGLGRIYNAEHQKSALRALWKYNFVPDYGPFRKGFPQGRHYATAGDAGLLMCTWPKGGLRDDFMKHWQYAYFNEFMTGFEYQAAAHMVAEGDDDLVQYGLAITRAIHDRYSPRTRPQSLQRNRMLRPLCPRRGLYAVFLAVCGFHFDQSKGLLRFDPVIQKENFKAPFTTSEGLGHLRAEGWQGHAHPHPWHACPQPTRHRALQGPPAKNRDQRQGC
jgi:non-lysosomal glucosylceramidase